MISVNLWEYYSSWLKKKIIIFFFIYLLANTHSTLMKIHKIHKIVVRGVLELTIRQNLQSFYRWRCYLLLCWELFMNTPKHNQFDTCFVTRVLIQIIYDNAVKVLSTLKLLSQRSRMVEGAGLAFGRGKRLMGLIRLETYIFILIFRFRSSLLGGPIQMKSSMTFIQNNRCVETKIILSNIAA